MKLSLRLDGRVRLALQVVCAVVAVALVARFVVRADAAATWRAVSGAGPWALLALLPFAVGMAADAWGTAALLRALGYRTTLAEMLPIRVAGEALHVTMPAGFLAADGAAAMLLESRCGVPVRDGVVAAVARKWLVMRSHAAYIAVGALAGFAALATLSRAIVASSALPWIVLGSALVPFALSEGTRAALLGRSTLARLRGALARLPSRRLARWVDAQRPGVDATDAQIARLRVAHGATAAATLSFLACWCCEALETALLLRLVGAQVELSSVFAVEAGLSMVRSAIVLAPSGLGVVDLGYVAMFLGMGASPESASAFVLLKRGKEAAWVAVGFALLAALRRPARRLYGQQYSGPGKPSPELHCPTNEGTQPFAGVTPASAES
jgi:uncharacterized membrane protein YbhN (UPF0104 family)